jgi:hypothetical protein
MTATPVSWAFMQRDSLDHHLYHWISVANERAERYGFPPGLLEESLRRLKALLGEDYLVRIFEATEELHLLGLREQELARWLRGGASVDDHVIQVMDLVATMSEFAADPSLRDKVDRLKRNSFWPSQFEMAMALRAKRTIGADGAVFLSPETNTAIGDFVINWKHGLIACECARLAFGDEEEEQYRLVGDLYQYADKQIKKANQRCCLKIRVGGPLVSTSFTATTRAIKTAFSRFGSAGRVSTEVEGAKVELEALTVDSERIPFRYIDGRVQDVLGTEWVTAHSLSYVNAKDGDEAAAMYRAGEEFDRDEYARVFISWDRNRPAFDPYGRILNKIKKKRHQTKSNAGIYGRIIFIEVQWDLELGDIERLARMVNHELDESRNTIAVLIAQRLASVHYRRWYKFYPSKIGAAYERDSSLIQFLNRFILYERDFDPILNRRYSRTWEEAAALVEQHKAEDEEQNRRREADL